MPERAPSVYVYVYRSSWYTLYDGTVEVVSSNRCSERVHAIDRRD